MSSTKEPQSLKQIPEPETAKQSAYIRIHVCQASYGDSLAIELDPTPPIDDGREEFSELPKMQVSHLFKSNNMTNHLPSGFSRKRVRVEASSSLMEDQR